MVLLEDGHGGGRGDNDAMHESSAGIEDENAAANERFDARMVLRTSRESGVETRRQRGDVRWDLDGGRGCDRDGSGLRDCDRGGLFLNFSGDGVEPLLVERSGGHGTQ